MLKVATPCGGVQTHVHDKDQLILNSLTGPAAVTTIAVFQYVHPGLPPPPNLPHCTLQPTLPNGVEWYLYFIYIQCSSRAVTTSRCVSPTWKCTSRDELQELKRAIWLWEFLIFQFHHWTAPVLFGCTLFSRQLSTLKQLFWLVLPLLRNKNNNNTTECYYSSNTKWNNNRVLIHNSEKCHRYTTRGANWCTFLKMYQSICLWKGYSNEY